MSGIIRVATRKDAAGMLEIYAPFILNSGITQETEVPSVEDFQQRVLANLGRKTMACLRNK
jgi:phosphinothricin acetyltransferase